MKRKITIAISLLAILAQYSCKDCYSCTNNCCVQISTQTTICNTDFDNDEEYYAIRDSLQGDIECDYFNIKKEACSEEEKEYLENNGRLGCIKKRKK